MQSSLESRVNAPPDLRRTIRDLARRQKLLSEKISRAEEMADKLACDLADFEEALETSGPAPQGTPDAGDAFARWFKVRNGRQILRKTAEEGVAAVDVCPHADGSATVRFNGGKEITLAPTLADLLTILCTDTGRSDDGLIGWMTLEEVAILLGKRTGRKVSRHAATQAIYRLRKELFLRGGVNPFLVQSSRRRGVRLALRRTKERAGAWSPESGV